MGKTIFLDRDGTINEDRGYMYKKEHLEFIPNSIKALELLQKENYTLVITTNQSGIGRKYYTEQEFHEFNNYILSELEENNVFINKTFYCPHSSENLCNCRKPNTGMLTDYLENNEIDYSNSYVIGDKTSDIKFGENLGLKTVLVKTGRAGNDKEYKSKPTHTTKDLFEAVKKIKNGTSK